MAKGRCTDMENRIELRGLRKRFGGSVALDGLTLDMEGGVFGILGGAGAGKSTLLRALATLLPLDGGEARVCGLPLQKAGAVRALVGYLPGDFGVYGNLRLREAMDYLGALSGLDALTRRARTAAMLERVGLAGEAEVRARCLDAGALRRLGVAQALIHDPRVLLLDEPTAGLAPEERARLRSLLSETAIDRLVVLATQRPDDVEAVCARVAVLDGGKLRYLGTAREMVARAEGKVFLADLPEEALPTLRRRYRVVSVVSHGQRRVARFLDPEGRARRRQGRPPRHPRRLPPLPERGRAGMSLFRLEFLRVCRSATYIAAVAALVLFAYFQQVFPPAARIAAAGGAAGGAGGLRRSRRRTTPSPAMWTAFPARTPASLPAAWAAALAVLCPFPAAALFWRDRRACRAAVYARGVSSLRSRPLPLPRR